MASTAPKVETAFRTFAMESPHAVRTLRKRLQDRYEAMASAMTRGYATDFADYKHRVGQLEGISIALGICDELQQEENQ